MSPELLQGELLAPIPGWGELYSASSEGRIFSHYTNRFISLHIIQNGYVKVDLSREGVNHSRQVHDLVLRSFRGPPPLDHESDHIDKSKINNRLDNLRWRLIALNRATKSRRKLSDEQVLDIRQRVLLGESRPLLATEFRVQVNTIDNVFNRKTYSDVV